MTPTATYIAEENCLQLLPTMEKPEPPLKPIYRRQFEPYYEELKEYERKRDQYNAHLATLRKIPCDPSCKGLWADGRKVVEGEDYEVRSICIGNGCYAGIDHPCVGCEKRAFPIVPVKSEDELWREAISVIKDCVKRESWDTIMAELKSKYSLTKR